MSEIIKWRDMSKEQPQAEGIYLVYLATGKYSVKDWAKLCHAKLSYDEEGKTARCYRYSACEHYEIVGEPFYGFIPEQSKWNVSPIKNVLFWMPILKVPEENKDLELLKKLKVQERIIKKQIASLKAMIEGR